MLYSFILMATSMFLQLVCYYGTISRTTEKPHVCTLLVKARYFVVYCDIYESIIQSIESSHWDQPKNQDPAGIQTQDLLNIGQILLASSYY